MDLSTTSPPATISDSSAAPTAAASSTPSTSLTVAVAMAPNEVGWSWVREYFQRNDAGINTYVKEHIITDIETELQMLEVGDAYNQFRDSCFRQYIFLDRDGFGCNQALHNILARQIHRDDASEFELWFRVGGHFLRFSHYEYALVTGLRFVGSTFDINDTYKLSTMSLYHRVSPHGKRILVCDLRRRFMDGEFRDSADQSVMVAKILFVYYMLICKDQRQTAVDRWVWALVEDKDGWESFPWGKYSFQILMHYVHSLRSNLPSKSGTRPPRYHLYGPSFALLIWAYEAIPSLGTACGTRVDGRMPRCIRWRFDKLLVDLSEIFSDMDLSCYATLEPTEAEQRQAYWEHLDGDLSEFLYIMDGSSSNPLSEANMPSQAIGSQAIESEAVGGGLYPQQHSSSQLGKAGSA